jgi:hypothetical protein
MAFLRNAEIRDQGSEIRPFFDTLSQLAGA